MADIDKIREKIAEIADRPKNVTFSEIEWVVNRLSEHGYAVEMRDARHGKLIQVDSQTFMVNYHNPGNKQIKAYSVMDFIGAMIELGLYE